METKELEHTIELLKEQIKTLHALVAAKDALLAQYYKLQYGINQLNPIVIPYIPLQTCDHIFPYWSTVPPTNCVKCGAPLPTFPQYTITCGSTAGAIVSGFTSDGKPLKWESTGYAQEIKGNING